jgi:class 3 adenylate cyclase
VNCPVCAHENRPGAKFCEECAAPQKRACASCGSELRPSAKFCDECGTPVGAAPAPRQAEAAGARKVVTIVFADLVGSTALHERLDPESARRFMEGYYAAMRGAVESHGGTVTQFLGDGVKAVFGVPRVAEDDAIRAVRAAVAMQAAFRALADPQREAIGKTGLRVAVNTGEVVANDASEIIGDPVNVAARLQEQGRDGDVVIGEATERLVSGLVSLDRLGSFALKGRTEAVAAYRVTSLDRPESAAAAAFVGRDDELARIRSVYETALEEPATGLAVLLGSPGLGKSRLIDEFARRLGDGATVVRAHCDAAGGASFAPLADALRILPDLDAAVPGSDAERARIQDGVRALLAGSPASPEETFFVVRRLLSALAATRPVVLVIDDLHWAEPLLLDLVEHLVQWGSGVPLLVLVGARPELREMRSTLATPGGLVSEVVTLAGLDAGAAMRLAANVIGAADLPASVAAKVLATSEGNPLFVGELVRMLVHEGALKREGDRWTAGTALAALEMPPTILALLASRIERLRPEERIVLERAAVVGRSFSRSAVAELLSREVADLDARLESLRRAELIERDTGWFLGEPVLRFHHVLIRDAAYRRILKGTRAELHARFADWVEARVGDAIEHDETIGWHLEQAHQHLRELGPIDVRGRALGERAAQRLAASGRRALARDDAPLASGLLGRALDRLDRDDPARAELALDWCEALLAAGDVGPATAALAELDRFAANEARLRAWHTCFAGQLITLTAPQELGATADAVAKAATDLAALGDVAGEAKAHFVHAQAFARLGKVGACEASLDRALAAARRAGDRRRANTVLAVAPLAALWGPSPVTRASGRCLDVVRVLRITQGAPAVEAVALSCQGVLEALRGRTTAARRMIASARKMVEELGITQRLLEADVFAARIDLLDGDAASAERGLRAAYDGMRELGLGIDAARAAALLARALLLLDRADEAEALTRESERLAGDDLQAAIAWRGARAEALARRGKTAEAVELASRAVEIAAATDALLDHADARLAFAVALRAVGRNSEADAEARRATELWEAKGATLLAERGQRESPQPVAAAARPEARVEASRSSRRRVRANQATASGPRVVAAINSRDFEELERLFGDPCVVVHYPTGLTYGRREQLSTWKGALRAEHLEYRREVLATLGDALELVRHTVSVSGLTEQALASFGLSDFHEIVVCEADGQGRYRRFEIFADDKLGEAVARLYARHAELLPEGPERERAAATARSVAVVAPGGFDVDRYTQVFRHDAAVVDHKLLGWGAEVGPTRLFQSMAAGPEVADQVASRPQDVLALSHEALLLRWQASGVGLESGGAFEWAFLRLFVFDTGGRVARYEVFEPDREAEALARFDALVAAEAPQRPVRRRVRANAASAHTGRQMAAIAAGDLAAVQRGMAEDYEAIHHPTATVAGPEAPLEVYGALLRGSDPRLSHETLATLGESLELFKQRRSISALVEGESIDAGAVLVDDLPLVEVDARGSIRRAEIFASDHLGDAIKRLYERYAELLPEGEQRERAATTARSLAVLQGPADIDVWVAAMAPDMEQVDHRLLGTWSARGAAEVLGHLRALLEVSDGALRVDDVLGASPDLLLVRQTHAGTDRASGGRYERVFLSLVAFARDGRVSRFEFFEPDREAEALARFDALVGGGEVPAASEPFANAASRADCRLFDCFHARDWAGIEALVAPELVFDERRRMMHNTCGREVWLEQFRILFDVPSSHFTSELLATRGERLALNLHRFEGEVAGGGGPLAIDDAFVLHEIDREGRIVAIVLFDEDDLDATYAELDARYAALEDEAHAASLTVMREFTRAVASRDWDPVLALCSPTLVEHDHRPLAVLGTTRGPEAWVQNFRMLSELATDSRYRVEHFRATARGFCSVGTWVGSREGGPYELPIVAVIELDDRKRIARADIYDADQLDRARARFDELATAAATPPRFENAATRSAERGAAAIGARDWEGFGALFAADLRHIDRRSLVQLDTDREGFLASHRQIVEMTSTRPVPEVLATRGDRLALVRMIWQGAEGDVGPSEIEWLLLIGVDERGDDSLVVAFDPGDLDAAYAELDARWAAAEAAAHPRASAWLRGYLAGFAARDWHAVTALFAPELTAHNHRLVGWGTLRDPAAVVATMRAQIELAPDTQERVDHVRTCERGVLWGSAWHGTREGGAFENQWIVAVELDALGRAHRIDVWEAEQLDRALARFEEIRASAPREARAALARPNAAGAAMERWEAAFDVGFETGDWEPMRALCAPDMLFDDRRRLSLLSGDRALMIASARERAAMGARPEIRMIGTAGDRIVLQRLLWSGGPSDGRFEIEYLGVVEVDAAGLITAIILLDSDDPRAAQREASARWEATHPVAAVPARLDELRFDPLHVPPNAAARASEGPIARLTASGDVAALRALMTDDFYFDDRSRWGMVRGGAEEWFRAVQLLRTETGAVRDARLIATAGDRLALYHIVWRETPGRSSFEIERFRITEIDAAGRLRGFVLCDQRAAASAALFERYVANGGHGMPWGLIEFTRGLNERDLVRARGGLCDDFVIEDHRRTGLGRIEGADAYIAAVAAAFELTRDARFDMLYVAASAEHGNVIVARWSGRNTEGGEFESYSVALTRYRGERVVAFEAFEPEELERALARFEETRAAAAK